MAVESKPLFHPEVLRQKVRSFHLPEQTAACLPKLQHWSDLISSGRADDFKETVLLPEFLSDIFCGLLGYTGPKRTENARLTRALADAEAELNDRGYRLFTLTADEVTLLQREVEH